MSDLLDSDSSWTCSPPMSPDKLSRPQCGHERPCVLCIEEEGFDAGRTYWACPVREYDDCEFVQWTDKGTPNSLCPGHCEHRLKALSEKYDVALRREALKVEILTDQLTQCTGEIDYLEAKLQAALNEAECHKRRTSIIVKGFAIAAVLVTFIFRLV